MLIESCVGFVGRTGRGKYHLAMMDTVLLHRGCRVSESKN